MAGRGFKRKLTKDDIWTALLKHGIERPGPSNFRDGPWVFEAEKRIHITGMSKLGGCEIALTSEGIRYQRSDDEIVIV